MPTETGGSRLPLEQERRRNRRFADMPIWGPLRSNVGRRPEGVNVSAKPPCKQEVPLMSLKGHEGGVAVRLPSPETGSDRRGASKMVVFVHIVRGWFEMHAFRRLE